MQASNTCPHCGMTYDQLRTGYTFADIRAMLWVNSDDSAEWKYKRRNTVLGYWRALKLAMWDVHLGQCEQSRHADDQEEDLEVTDDWGNWCGDF